jgi:very-short-patch-repair endonuclease
LKLIIEVDGGIHADTDIRKKDSERQNNLEAEGISFIRLTNAIVEKDMDYVVKTIEEFINTRGLSNVNGK